jgi:hypothetical protein
MDTLACLGENQFQEFRVQDYWWSIATMQTKNKRLLEVAMALEEGV